MIKQVKIKIVSRVYDLQKSDQMEKYIEAHPDLGQDDISDKYEVSCRGTLEEKDGRLSLCYDEPKNGDMGLTHTRISMDMNDMGSVTLERTGEVNSVFVYDERVGRRVYVYETQLMTFDLGIATKRLINRMTPAGGTLHMDYKIDVRGSNMERTVIDIMAREIRS